MNFRSENLEQNTGKAIALVMPVNVLALNSLLLVVLIIVAVLTGAGSPV